MCREFGMRSQSKRVVDSSDDQSMGAGVRHQQDRDVRVPVSNGVGLRLEYDKSKSKCLRRGREEQKGEMGILWSRAQRPLTPLSSERPAPLRLGDVEPLYGVARRGAGGVAGSPLSGECSSRTAGGLSLGLRPVAVPGKRGKPVVPRGGMKLEGFRGRTPDWAGNRTGKCRR